MKDDKPLILRNRKTGVRVEISHVLGTISTHALCIFDKGAKYSRLETELVSTRREAIAAACRVLNLKPCYIRATRAEYPAPRQTRIVQLKSRRWPAQALLRE